MDQKSVKAFLPTTYEQFLALKKKANKISVIVKPYTSNDNPRKNENQSFLSKSSSETEFQQIAKENNSGNITEKILFSDYKKIFEDFKNIKYESLVTRMNQEVLKLKQKTTIQLLSVSQLLSEQEIQSLENIESIKKEFQAASGKRNINKLEEMLSFNKFFLILNKEKRWKIFDNCSFEQYQAKKIIYSEGEPDDYMFVIIKGCVRQYQHKMTSYNQKIVVNFISHYEGANFGEPQGYSETQKRGKRYHTTEATQKCYLLKISNKYYRELIESATEDDFEKKLSSLMDSAIFRQTSQMMVTPLMSTLEKHNLPYGKVLIRQGQEVRRLYFVAEGTLNVIYLDRARRNMKHLNIEQKPQNFHLSKPRSQQKSRSKNKSYSIHTTFYYPSDEPTTKQFIYGKKKLVGDEIEYNDQVVFCELRVGDFFGGKSFLSHIDKQKKEQNSEFFDSSLKSKLSVICSSTQSLVYSIDQKKFFSLSENLQKLIIKGVMTFPYFDEYNIEQKLSSQRNWKKYAQNLVQNVIRGKKDRNHSFRN